jgi:hypothetical protein
VGGWQGVFRDWRFIQTIRERKQVSLTWPDLSCHQSSAHGFHWLVSAMIDDDECSSRTLFNVNYAIQRDSLVLQSLINDQNRF